MSYKLIHNPRCSKSREAKALLEEKGIRFEVVEYLQNPLNQAELTVLARQLHLRPIDMVRRKEDAFEKHGLGAANVTDAQVLAAIASDPVLLERPILVKGKKAVIGRPTERLLELLS
jgi:arsenate reductase